MKGHQQARREAKQLFRACLVNGLPDDKRSRQVVSLLLEKKPRGYMAILTQFQRLLKLDVQRRTARVDSATDLSPQQKEAIETSLRGLMPEGLEIHYRTEPKLIGGLRVKLGSDVYDTSISGKLAALAESF